MSIVSYVLVPRAPEWDGFGGVLERELDMRLVQHGVDVYYVVVRRAPALLVQLETRESNGDLELESWPEWIRPLLVERAMCLAVQAIGDDDDVIGQLQAFVDHAARELDGIIYIPEADLLVDGGREIERGSSAPSDDDEPDDAPPPEISGLGVCVLEFRREVDSDELAAAAREIAPDLVVQQRAGNWTRVALADGVVWLDFRRAPKRGLPFYVRCEIIDRESLEVPDPPAVELARRIVAQLKQLDVALIDFELGATAGLGDEY